MVVAFFAGGIAALVHFAGEGPRGETAPWIVAVSVLVLGTGLAVELRRDPYAAAMSCSNRGEPGPVVTFPLPLYRHLGAAVRRHRMDM